MRKIATFLWLALFLIASLHAGEMRYRYLPAAPETLVAQIPPPPGDDSPAGMADLETVLQVQRERTHAQVERAGQAAKYTAMQMGAGIFGPGFTKENLPRTAAFLEEIRQERHEVTAIAKERWMRARPYDRGAGVTPCVYRPGDTSYPSGHSAAAACWATIYSAAFPAYAALFEAEMREALWGRVLGGVHYPSDTQAGKRLGILLAKEMLKNPVTQKALEEVRQEVAAFLKDHPEAAAHARKRLETSLPR